MTDEVVYLTKPEDQEKSARHEMSRGAQAQAVVDNPIYQEAFMLIRADLMSKFEGSTFRQMKVREQIYRELKAVNKMEDIFTQVMQNGKMGESTLATLKRKIIG